MLDAPKPMQTIIQVEIGIYMSGEKSLNEGTNERQANVSCDL